MDCKDIKSDNAIRNIPNILFIPIGNIIGNKGNPILHHSTFLFKLSKYLLRSFWAAT